MARASRRPPPPPGVPSPRSAGRPPHAPPPSLLSKRRILPPESLRPYGASEVYATNDDYDDDETPPTSKEEEEPPQPIGIGLGGWYITTGRSTLGTEGEMDELTAALEGAANDAADSDEDRDGSAASDDGDSRGRRRRRSRRRRRRRRRRLAPPEMVFPGSYVSLRYVGKNDDNDATTTSEAAKIEIRFDATSALLEWAEAHRRLPLPSSASSAPSVESGGEETSESEAPSEASSSSSSGTTLSSYRGVEILKSIDADLWSRRRSPSSPLGAGAVTSPRNNASTAAAAVVAPSEFHYDWTYSTPYSGTLLPSSASPSIGFKPVPTSGINLPLLSDTSQPILLFDDVDLYEDDMHDNGDVTLSVKLRVMPSCWFVLCRLYVRVDYVLIRVRETRIFHEFGTGNVCRDVTWRECKWDELVKNGLPNDCGSWREGYGDVDASAQRRFHGLLGRVPSVERLPEGIVRHSILDVGEFAEERNLRS